MKLKSTNKIMLLIVAILTVSSVAFGQSVDEGMLKFFKYREIGPTRQSGRFVDFAVPTQQPFTFYAATGSGGLMKTVNNGQSFENIFDNESVISIGDIAVAPSDPNIVWVGSGEANTSRSTYWGDGMYKSTDAGKTWKNMGLKESHHIGRIVIHPKNPNIVYVAALGHLYSENSERGLYKTTNGGKSWNKVLAIKAAGKDIGVVEVVMDPKNNNTLYATTYDKVRRPWTFNEAGPGSAVYKSTNAGKSWTKLTNGIPGGMIGRIGIDISLKNPKILYINIENSNAPGVSEEDRHADLLAGRPTKYKDENGRERTFSPITEVYRSNDGGKSWKKASPDGVSIGGGPGYYYNDIRVDPNDPDHVYVLATSMHETKDGGKTWASPFRFGGDNHAMWINPENSDHMLLGYDHGMGVTWDRGKNWYHPDNQSLAQFYAIGVDMDYPYNVYGGLQDNGSVKGPSTKRDGGNIRFEDWERVGGGDGFYNQVDPTDSRWLYNESQFGSVSRLDQVTGERVSIKPTGKGLRFNWNSPILISPHNPNVVYFGANKLFKSTARGIGMEAVSDDLTTNDEAKIVGTGNIQYCTITTIDESPIKAGLIYIGTDDGNVQVTKNGGRKWTLLNTNITGNPGYWVSRVTASAHDEGTAYVTYTGYRRDDFKPYVYKTTDFGKTWKSIANNLPEEAINVIKEDRKNPNLLFLGTEMAAYVSLNGGASWTRMKNNMPTNGVQDLLIHPRENDLVIGTHGRGIYITDITPLQEMTSEVLAKEAYLFDIEAKVNWHAVGSTTYGYHNFDGESEAIGSKINYYLGSGGKDVKVTVYQGTRAIAEYKGSNDAGLNSVLWNFSERVKQSEEAAERAINRLKRWYGDDIPKEAIDNAKYRSKEMPPGEYTVKLTVDGKVFTKKAVVLQDTWYKK